LSLLSARQASIKLPFRPTRDLSFREKLSWAASTVPLMLFDVELAGLDLPKIAAISPQIE
jgi:hypothetical protein